MPIAGHAPMPCCGPKDQAPILAAVETMPATHRRQARAFVARIGTRGVCELLHSMRRWYANGWNAHVAKRILKHRDAIVRHGAMRLDPPVGAHRGFKVDASSDLAELKAGDGATLPVTRNGGASSWTESREVASSYAGASKGKVGVVVRLASGAGVKTLIAPPDRSASWFNELYRATMGKAWRDSQSEYVLLAPKVKVDVVDVKRR